MEKQDRYKWVKIAETVHEIEFQSNGLIEIKAEDKTICLSVHENVLSAFAALCPHASGRLADGYLDAVGNLVCPLHRYKFNPKNGRNVSGEGYYLKSFPLEIRKDGVFVGFKENNWFN